MTAISINTPFILFADATGNPLESGSIYIGTAGLNPETNPVAVFWDQALTIPATQPLKTSGGYVVRNGTPSRIYANGADFSMTVRSKIGGLVWSALSSTGISPNSSGVVYNPSGAGAVASTVQSKLRESVSVKDFGAVGDGVTDDTVAIQTAIDAVYAAGGGSLYFPSGTYWLATTNGVHKVLLRPRPNIRYYGDGRSTVLKAAPQVQGAFNVMRHVNDDSVLDVSNVVFEDFTVDCNGQNNLALPSPFVDQVAIGIEVGSNIVVNNVYVKNCSGRQVFTFGQNATPRTVSNLSITNCQVYKVSTDVAGNTGQTDHSSIYFQANRVIVTGNRFYNDIANTVATAIEIHGNDLIISDNIIDNYQTGIITSALQGDSVDVLISNNIISAVLAWYVYSDNNKVMDRIVFDANVLYQNAVNTAGRPFLDMGATIATPVTGSISVTNNIIVGNGAIGNYSSNFGLEFGNIAEMRITNNKFKNIVGRSINQYTISNNNNTAIIEDNEFINCGTTTNASYKDVIGLFNAAFTMPYLSVKGNFFRSDSSTYSNRPVYGNTIITKFSAKDNTVIGAGFTLDIDWLAGKLTSSQVVHTTATGVVPTIPMSQGSEWNDVANGYYYKKVRGGVDNYVNKTFSVTSIPTTGAHLGNDRAMNVLPTVGQPKSWVCTVSGTPGTWVSEGNL